MTPHDERVLRLGEVPAALTEMRTQPRVGLTIEEISRELLVPMTRVRALIKRHGLPTMRGVRDGQPTPLVHVSLVPTIEALYWSAKAG